MINYRTATLNDLDALVDLEKEWPLGSRATRAQLIERLEKFNPGFIVAETKGCLIANIICCPFYYDASSVCLYKSWHSVVKHCYSKDYLSETSNALYIVSGVIRAHFRGSDIFLQGVKRVIQLANALNKQYVVAGALLPGLKKFLEKHPDENVDSYVFRKYKTRYLDPLIQSYHTMGFSVPDKRHVKENYFPNSESLNYSALVVKDLTHVMEQVC